MSYNNGEHDDDVTAVETPHAILERVVGHMVGVANSIKKASPRLQSLRGAEREWLAFGLADECDELRDALDDLANAFRTIGRE